MTSLLVAAVLVASPTLVTVDGDGLKPTTFTRADFDALTPVKVEYSDKQGAHSGLGVRLDKLLLKAGFSEGAVGPKVDPKVKHAGLRAAVIATASDGFVAVFSIGELLETLGATTAFVVFEADGKPLPENVGPVRLVVPTDKGGSRAIHQLTALHVKALP